MGNIDFKQILTNIILFLPRMGTAIIIVLVFWLLAWIVGGILRRFAQNRRLSRDLVHLLDQIVNVFLLIFGIVTALGTLGIDAGAMIAGLGLVGFALGFALKDLLANFLSGLLILIYNPFVNGDTINVVGNEGKVIEVNLRYTVLQDTEKQILIPNSTLFSNPVIVQHGPVSKPLASAAPAAPPANPVDTPENK